MGIVTTIAPVALALIMLGLGASLTVKDAPNPNMISANAVGAIVVTIPIKSSLKFISIYLAEEISFMK